MLRDNPLFLESLDQFMIVNSNKAQPEDGSPRRYTLRKTQGSPKTTKTNKSPTTTKDPNTVLDY